jgi:6-phosphogluconolactonase
MRVLVGSFGNELSLFEHDGKNFRHLPPSVEVSAPTFLAVHSKLPIVYVVSESDVGAVTAFRLAADGSPRPASRLPTGGAEPCHVAVSADGRHVVCANYGTGNVSVFATRPDGDLDRRSDVVRHVGSGPNPERQEGPHAHQVTVLGDTVSAVDLGTDQIVHYGLSADGRLQPAGVTTCPAGSGPRHLVIHPSGRRFLANELASTISTYDASYQLVDSQPATLVGPDGDNLPSELVLSPDGRYLYLANRGNDSIVTFAVTDSGLRPLDEVATGGAWPRHIAIVEDSLLVANQRADTITALRIDPDSGVPGPAVEVAALPAPACLLPLPTRSR